MKKIITKILLSFIVLTIGLFINLPIEFQNKPTQIIIENLVYLLALTIIFFIYKNGIKIKRPFNWISIILNSFFLLIIGYKFLWIIGFDFTDYDHHPVWTDQHIYINQTDTTQIIVGQEYRISGSIIDWRVRKVNKIIPGIRWTRPASIDTLNGKWRFINKEFDFDIKDTIANFKAGKMIDDNNNR
jgi:hypothetical protein